MQTSNRQDKMVHTSRLSRLPAGLIAIWCLGASAAILAFLIPFGIIQPCSSANIAIFITLFALVAALVVAGFVFGVLGLRKLNLRLRAIAILVVLVDIGLLLYLFQLLRR
jgi:hypothetical protein